MVVQNFPWCNGVAGISFAISLTCSPLAAEIKLGPGRIGARTDGGLQIFLPQDSLVAWDRSYYEIALEVSTFQKQANFWQNGSSNQNATKMGLKPSRKSTRTTLSILAKSLQKC